MSVNSYLQNLASSLVLSQTENLAIAVSSANLTTKIKNHFGSEIVESFKFGSITRGTILPRKADENSDVDFMIVFNNSGNILKPASYLAKLKSFVEKAYSRSEVFQSHPTIVLELSHIKFELVPALIDYFGSYKIPSSSSGYSEWLTTNPNQFNSNLTASNQKNGEQIKPVIRLFKYWNTRNGRHFNSFGLEKTLSETPYFGNTSLSDYFFSAWENILPANETPRYIQDKMFRAKEQFGNIKKMLLFGYTLQAEQDLQRLLPKI